MAFLIPAHRSTLSFPHFCRCSRSVDNNWIPVLLWYCEMKKSSTRFWHYVHVRFSWRVAEKVSSSLSNFISSIRCLTIFTNVIELLLHFVGSRGQADEQAICYQIDEIFNILYESHTRTIIDGFWLLSCLWWTAISTERLMTLWRDERFPLNCFRFALVDLSIFLVWHKEFRNKFFYLTI